ncbi:MULTISPECIES: hypothetical protein [Hydrocarboniphaga]|jgi:hypothetical protein|uniref:Uncharacterized protein n=1 Tax=Hydrocarboniphaga effusa AP103 TaxID=1172194 RepID=I8I1K7_9GAMM|nr:MULTISPECIES: hypothetical protein [Hydrocarboniphaga]EIT69601.1 hypothetical protein WQQ_31830 [Hydrocarboniphaga effusa AP103]MDZ4080087.1 hypothetical protein [Hydrocarboniphaga sp.]
MQKTILATLGMACLFAATQASAQQTAAPATVAARPTLGLAAASFQAPVGFGASWGAVGAGVYAQTLDNLPGGGDSDGAAGVVIGLGDASEYAGLELGAVFSSLTGDNSDDSFGDSGSFAAKLHTNLPGNAAFAIGVVGAQEWGSSGFKNANSSSVYTAVTKAFRLGNHVAILNLGAGDNVFNSPDKNGIGVFGSGSFYFTQWLSVIGEYSGRFANAAVSIAPLPKYLPLTITLGAINLTEKYGQDVEFGGSVGIGYSFK